jgi:hypothetical protein
MLPDHRHDIVAMNMENCKGSTLSGSDDKCLTDRRAQEYKREKWSAKAVAPNAEGREAHGAETRTTQALSSDSKKTKAVSRRRCLSVLAGNG